MMPRTYYHRVLDVDVGADGEALRAAYRRRVKECHPDAQPGGCDTTEEFKRIVLAYRILMQEIESPPAELDPEPETRPTSDPEEAARRTFRTGARGVHAERCDESVHWYALDRRLDALPLSELAQRFSASQNHYVRAAAARALARRRDLPAVLVLLRGLDTAEPALRQEIVRCLGATGSRRALYSLARLLSDEDAGLAHEAALAMRRIDPRLARRVSARVLHSGSRLRMLLSRMRFW